MSKFSKRGQRRAAGAASVAAVAVVGLASMGAGSAVAAPLANGYKESSGLTGERVQIWRTGESYAIGRSVANIPTVRSGGFNGNYTTKLSKGLNGNTALKLIVGCQVDVTGLSLGLGAGFSTSGLSASGSLSLPLAPGQVKVVDLYDKDIPDGGTVTLQAAGLGVTVSGCAGYASARSAVKVVAGKGFNTDDGTVNGEGTYMQSILYGQPFSLG